MIARRLAAWTLVGAVLGASALPHRHLGLEPEPGAGRRSPSVLTTHNPLAKARHWHAVLKIVEEDPCWVCQGNRIGILVPSASTITPVLTRRRLGALPPRSALSVARYTRPSRAPPKLPREAEI